MLFGRDVYDGAWRLFDYDPASGRTVWILHDGDKTHFRTDYPVDHLIQDNAEANVEAMGKRWGEAARVASIPANIYYDSGMAQAVQQGDQRFASRWLNDSDNSAWRTRGGTV